MTAPAAPLDLDLSWVRYAGPSCSGWDDPCFMPPAVRVAWNPCCRHLQAPSLLCPAHHAWVKFLAIYARLRCPACGHQLFVHRTEIAP